MHDDTDTRHKPKKGVALGGFMGTGKTTVARVLASQLALAWVDSDAVLVERHGPIGSQFAEHGEALFRARERAVVLEIAAGGRQVVATGGGVFADPALRQALRERFTLVCLRASLPTLRERLGDDAERPLWSAEAGALLEARAADYADVDWVIDVDGKSVDDVVREVLACIG